MKATKEDLITVMAHFLESDGDWDCTQCPVKNTCVTIPLATRDCFTALKKAFNIADKTNNQQLLDWKDNTTEPEIGSMILINTNIVNIFEDSGEDDDFEISTKILSGMVVGRGGINIEVWNGEHTGILRFENVIKWTYMPTFKPFKEE